MEGILTVDRFQSICRTCLCDCKNIISFNIDDTLIFETVRDGVVSKCTSVQMSKKDTLPKQLCQQCFEDVTNCHNFIEKYQRSDRTLRSILNKESTTINLGKVESQLDEVKQEEIDLDDLATDRSNILDSLIQNHYNTNTQNPDVHIQDKQTMSKVKRQIQTLWRCKRCSQTFHKLSTVQFHSCINKGKKQARCNKDDKLLKKGNMLKVNILRKHQQEEPYKCCLCKKSFAGRAQLVIHEKVHQGKKLYTCEMCDRGFSQKALLKRHLNTHSHNTCGFPEKKHFSWNRDLTIHTKTQDFYSCSLCKKSVKGKAQQSIHERTHTGGKSCRCCYCEKGFVAKGRKNTHTKDKPFKCCYCYMSFDRKGHLTVHERRHTGEKPYKCGFCDKSFAKKGHLTIHERSHKGEKPYKCSYCEKSFVDKGQVTIHERAHTGEKPYRCRYCNKGCVHKGQLMIHERTHTGEKPYRCSYCEKRFAEKGKLTLHERIHTGEKPYKCGYCYKCFVHKAQLTVHERIHTGEKPFGCGYCDKGFVQKSQLIVHERTHTREKPYKCSFCDKGFVQKPQLIVHERTHTGKRPYKCGFCDRGFVGKGQLTIHERTHTREKP